MYEIDVPRYTECVGFYATQTCMDVRPINSIEQHPKYQESEQQLSFKMLNAKC